jgi:hypothetical protein
MRLPHGEEQVPFTAGVSGIVLVLFWFKFGSTTMLRDEAVILGLWGLIYLVEIAVRTRLRSRTAVRSVERDVDAGAALDPG